MFAGLQKIYKKRLFSNDEISYLVDLFDKGLETQNGTWQNLSGIFKTESIQIVDSLQHFIKKQKKYATSITNKNWRLRDIFLLEYHPGGQANLHYDIHSEHGGISLITLVEQEDLVGGDIIIREDQWTDIDTKIPLDVGETVVYSASVIHGVTKVESGFRRVLVTWLDPRGE